MASHQFETPLTSNGEKEAYMRMKIKVKRTMYNLMSSHGVCAHRRSIIDEERIENHLKDRKLKYINQMKTDGCKGFCKIEPLTSLL